MLSQTVENGSVHAELCAGGRKLPTQAGSDRAGSCCVLSQRWRVLQANLCSARAGLLEKGLGGPYLIKLLCVVMWKFSNTSLPVLVKKSHGFFCGNQNLQVWAGLELLM